MNVYRKIDKMSERESLKETISKMSGKESYEEKLYQILMNSKRYKKQPYKVDDLEEGMAVIYESIGEWWKPRFLMNHNAHQAYEFMNERQILVTVTEDDIDWESLKGLPESAQSRARSFSFQFPSFIRRFKNGVAEVSWQLNPDGRYYMDDEGFGMTNDKEITIYGYIDQNAKVVVKFRSIHHYDELVGMRHQAEQISKNNNTKKKTNKLH